MRFLGLIITLLALVLGVYVGFYLCFIGGIATLLGALINGTVLTGGAIAFALVKIFLLCGLCEGIAWIAVCFSIPALLWGSN